MLSALCQSNVHSLQILFMFVVNNNRFDFNNADAIGCFMSDYYHMAMGVFLESIVLSPIRTGLV